MDFLLRCLLALGCSIVMFSSISNGSEDKSEIGSSNWLNREAVMPMAFPTTGLFRQRLARKHLRQLLNHKRRRAFRRKQKLLKKKSARGASVNLPKRPNIILMMADDQDTELGSLNYMPKLKRYLQEEGKNRTFIAF